MFEIDNLASKVKIDLGGQRSFGIKLRIYYLAIRVSHKISLQNVHPFFNYKLCSPRN